MAAPQQDQQASGQEVAKLFQNVGQGLVLIAQYVSQVSPESKELVDGLMQGFEQLVQQVGQARQGGARQPQTQGPASPEAGAAEVRPV